MTEEQQHDIRNGLMAIGWHTKKLLRGSLDGEEKKAVAEIQRELIRIGTSVGMVECRLSESERDSHV